MNGKGQKKQLIKAILFDLDDTLFPEGTYRESGLRHIARTLASEEETYKLLKHYDQKTGKALSGLVEELIQRYRGHEPEITCYPDVLPALRRLGDRYKLGLISNNSAGTQYHKLSGLKIERHFESIVIAERPKLKPHPEPFEISLSNLGTEPTQTVYVADWPEVDFPTSNRMGMVTVMIERPDKITPSHVPEGCQPKHEIETLDELDAILESYGA